MVFTKLGKKRKYGSATLISTQKLKKLTRDLKSCKSDLADALKEVDMLDTFLHTAREFTDMKTEIHDNMRKFTTVSHVNGISVRGVVYEDTIQGILDSRATTVHYLNSGSMASWQKNKLHRQDVQDTWHIPDTSLGPLCMFIYDQINDTFFMVYKLTGYADGNFVWTTVKYYDNLWHYTSSGLSTHDSPEEIEEYSESNWMHEYIHIPLL